DRGVSWRPCRTISGPRLADRTVLLAALASAHAAALAADDGRAAVVVAGAADVATVVRLARAGSGLLGGSAISVASDPFLLRSLHSPGGGAAALRRGDMALAFAAGVRSRLALQRVSLPAACLLSNDGAGLLVSRRSPVSEPATMVGVAA